jgi:hypothetical protein
MFPRRQPHGRGHRQRRAAAGLAALAAAVALTAPWPGAGSAPGAISGPARHSVSCARHRVVPVVLASTPDAPWSFTGQPSHHPDESLHSVIA